MGVAVFRGGLLAHCARVTSLKIDAEQDGARWLRVARDVEALLRTTGDAQIVSHVIYERPQIYAASRSKGDPNNLIGLAGVGASIAALCSPIEVLTPTPAQWCGQLPKTTKGSAMTSPRAIRIMSRLDAAERLRVPDQHDVVDAVGLGLHALGRLEIRRAYASSL